MAKYSIEEQLDVLGRICLNLTEAANPIMEKIFKSHADGDFAIDEAIDCLDCINMLFVVEDIAEDIGKRNGIVDLSLISSDPDIRVMHDACKHLLPILKMIQDMEDTKPD